MTSRRTTIREARAAAYTTGRILGDLDAALSGPGAYARRRIRARAYRGTFRPARRLLRHLGL
jgi:hypothetical protein